MAKSISKLRKVSRAQISRLNKDELIESILTFTDETTDNPQLTNLSETLNALKR